MSTDSAERPCVNHFHNQSCRTATELARYPHDMIPAEEHLDWIDGDVRCKNCYAFQERRLAQPCMEHPDRPPTLTINYPTCNGCGNETSHDGDNLCCETCGVFWPNGTEDEFAQRYEDDLIRHACGGLS